MTHEIAFCCPYCGAEYGARLMCCGENSGHGVWVIDGNEEKFYGSLEEAKAALAAEGDEDGR